MTSTMLAVSASTSFTRKSVTVEKIQDRSVPHAEYLARIGDDDE